MNCTGKNCIMQYDKVDPATCPCVSYCPQAALPKTNADCIRCMSDEELAEILHFLKNKCGGCPVAKSNIFCSTFPTCKDAWLAWLKLEVE